MESEPFTPEQFQKRPAVAQVDVDLRKWLRGISVEKRLEFIRALWPLNYTYSMSLARSSQLPNSQVEALLVEWLRAGQENAGNGLVALEPLLGKVRFWKVVDATDLTEEMRNFFYLYRKSYRRYDDFTGA